MNANELADWLEANAIELPADWTSGEPKNNMTLAATMLRSQSETIASLQESNRQQQAEIEAEKLYSSMKHDEVLALQAEIEALKYEISTLRYEKSSGVYDDEPVAWFEQDENMKSVWYQCDKDDPSAVPLYTHPSKDLTDEEITEIYNKVYEERPDNQVIALARAILKKAQEK